MVSWASEELAFFFSRSVSVQEWPIDLAAKARSAALVVFPSEARLFLQGGIKQHKTIRVFGLTQEEDQFLLSIVVVITGVKERHKRSYSSHGAVRRYKEPRIRERIVRIIDVSTFSRGAQSGLYQKSSLV